MDMVTLGKRIKIAVFAASIVIITAILSYLFVVGGMDSQANANNRMQETDIKINYDFQSYSSFAGTAGGFFYSTKDGMKFIDAAGNEKMSHTYSLIAPIMVGEARYAAVYEQKGKTLYVYDESGLIYHKSFEANILSVAVNSKGYASVICQSGDTYEICLYNEMGVALKKHIYNETFSFPISTDISDDGRILAVAFLDFSGVEVTSKILFIYANQAEYIKYTDGIFSSIVGKSGQYLGMIKFISGNNLLVVSDSEISLIEVGTASSVRWSWSLNNKLSGIAFLGSNGFAVAFGEPLKNRTPEPEGLVKFFDLNLKQTGEYQSDSNTVSYISAGFNSVIFESSKTIYAVSKEGKLLWSYNAVQDIKQAVFVENTSKALLASNNTAIIYKLTKEKADPEVQE